MSKLICFIFNFFFSYYVSSFEFEKGIQNCVLLWSTSELFICEVSRKTIFASLMRKPCWCCHNLTITNQLNNSEFKRVDFLYNLRQHRLLQFSLYFYHTNHATISYARGFKHAARDNILCGPRRISDFHINNYHLFQGSCFCQHS